MSAAREPAAKEGAAKGEAERSQFTAMLDEYFAGASWREGQIVTGRICALENDSAVIDVGLKTEGRIPLHEITGREESKPPAIGDEIEVYIERVENALGEAVLSCDKARREKAWKEIERIFQAGEKVEGQLIGRVKGGFTVDLGGVRGFLPGSQVDVRPVLDVTPLMGRAQLFYILTVDRKRNNIVVSRRRVMEENRGEALDKMLDTLQEGQVVDGVVKNITDFGAFVDLGGIDGLLHVTHMSWRRIQSPHDVLSVGDKIRVKIIKINPDTHRVNLGIKQLEADPWEGLAAKYPVGSKIRGRVTNITEYGAFVEIEPGVEGLVHISEMSWMRKNRTPEKIVSVSQEVDAQILDMDLEKSRISLSIKQCQSNPWQEFSDSHPAGSKISGEIVNITEHGLFVALNGEMDARVHISDLAWQQPGAVAIKAYKKGQTIEAQVLEVEPNRERIALGIKQMSAPPLEKLGDIKEGQTITCTVAEVKIGKAGGIDVHAGGDDGPLVFIRRSELARDHSEQRPERFAPGQKVDARIMQLRPESGRIILSIKAREVEDEREAVAQYGSAKSGASLGDILGRALNKKDETAPSKTPEAKTEAKTEAKAKPKAKAKTAAKADEEKPAKTAKKTPDKTEGKTEGKTGGKTKGKTGEASE